MRNSIRSRSSGRTWATAESSMRGRVEAELSFTREQNKTLSIEPDSLRLLALARRARTLSPAGTEKRFGLGIGLRRADIEKTPFALHPPEQAARHPFGHHVAL